MLLSCVTLVLAVVCCTSAWSEDGESPSPRRVVDSGQLCFHVYHFIGNSKGQLLYVVVVVVVVVVVAVVPVLLLLLLVVVVIATASVV